MSLASIRVGSLRPPPSCRPHRAPASDRECRGGAARVVVAAWAERVNPSRAAERGPGKAMRQRFEKILGLLVLGALVLAASPAAAALPVNVQVRSSTGGSDLPFTFGQAFAQGDVPSGSNLVGSIAALQVVAKNRWPDGSLKFAIVSGRTTLAANVPSTISLSLGSPS